MEECDSLTRFGRAKPKLLDCISCWRILLLHLNNYNVVIQSELIILAAGSTCGIISLKHRGVTGCILKKVGNYFPREKFVFKSIRIQYR